MQKKGKVQKRKFDAAEFCRKHKVIWAPNPRQAAMERRMEFEALYGGAAGGGKSDFLVVEALRQINNSQYRGIIFRKTYPELEDIISRSMELYGVAFPKAGRRFILGQCSTQRTKSNTRDVISTLSGLMS